MGHHRFHLRRANPLDASAVTRVLTASYSTLLVDHYAPEVLAAALPVMSQANPQHLSSGRYFLVEATGGDVVSVGGWSEEAPGSGTLQPGLGHIRHVATHPDWAGQGAAGRILAHVIAHAAQAGCTRLSCMSTLTAVPFYAQFGFEPIAERGVDMGPGIQFPAIEMLRLPKK